MPFTPFHFGLGIFLKSLKPQRLSLSVFIWVQVLIDTEVLFNMINPSERLHGFFHSFLGSSVVAIAVCFGFLLAYEVLDKLEKKYSLSELLASAFLGSSSHTLLDSVMHFDLTPFQPFSRLNPLLNSMSVLSLHLMLVILGALGGVVLLIRFLLVKKN